MKLILNTLVINNFKGIKDLSIQFDPFNTGIYAANEVGKTTVSDAWHWLLTGKNSADQKDFNIKNTVDTSLNRADHEVTALISANGTEVNLKKVYREKWQKKRGTEIAEYVGNETLYFFNEVPVQQYDYQAKLNGLFDENVLKMITNPLYFNSNTTNWGWRNRREILLAIAGNISDDEIFTSITTADNRSAVAKMIEKLQVVKTTQDYKKMIGEQKKKLKSELEMIPARIDEATRSKPEILDWAAIELQIKNKNAAIAKIDAAISDSNLALQLQNELLAEHQSKIHKLNARKNEISYSVQNEINTAANQQRLRRSELVNKITEAERTINHAESTIKDLTNYRDTLNNEIVQLRAKWGQVNATTIEFNEHQFTCPTCLRDFAPGDIDAQKEALTKNFNSDKVAKLEQMNKDGAVKNDRLKDIEKDIAASQELISNKTAERNTAESELQTFDASNQQQQGFDSILAGNAEYIQLNADLAKLNGNLPQVTRPDNSELIAQKQGIIAEIDELKKQLNTQDQICRSDKRIADLEDEEKTLSQQLADLERTEFLIDNFDRAKMDIMEARVNGKFRDVTFRLFDRQVNGGESPTCETMYKGVPFSDLNTAGRIWAGICIINTLSEFYGISAPIFLDNRESVSNIPDTTAQVINLVVSENDKKIRIVTGAEQLAVA